ncbi:hypothetical protein BJ122_10597 [Rhodopseudomonas faecalis]|uniref:Uncharacterized protein n=1 Tax=Rhodopseudomonas faecalis TaxID=99655 RepID=A0A318TJ67_9BRAD|nr:hypothetical protein [Rhodopseudomonas faecalis]PYF03840.1 hypothetical protein BJ122_10597 [Rhodopseudomonas faecalis]
MSTVLTSTARFWWVKVRSGSLDILKGVADLSMRLLTLSLRGEIDCQLAAGLQEKLRHAERLRASGADETQRPIDLALSLVDEVKVEVARLESGWAET